MSDILDHSGLPEDELLAAEYALGVLAGVERAAVEQRIARDQAFARLVNEWEQRLAPWAANLPEVAPPSQLWNSIAAALPAHTRERSGLVGQPQFLARVQLCHWRARRGMLGGPAVFGHVHTTAASGRNH